MSEVSDFARERYASTGMSDSDFSAERIKIVLNWLPPRGRLLEIGVWDGSIVRHYSQVFRGEIYGLDVDEEVMRKARPWLYEAKVCDLNRERIPWEDGFFDVVVCNEVIEHLFDTDRLVREICRVCRAGALVIMSTPNLASLLNRGFILLGYQPLSTEVSAMRSNYGNPWRRAYRPAGHVRAFTKRAFVELLQVNGLDILEIKAAPIVNRGILRVLDRLVARCFPGLGSDVVVLARKRQITQGQG